MLGAVIGDLAGSIYEFAQIKAVKGVKIRKLMKKNSFISDDTILTMAILQACLTDKNYEKALKEFGLKYENMLPKMEPYFKSIFSPNFDKWLHGDFVGVSSGNGAMMRVSPIGYLFDDEKSVVENARLATIPSHNSAEAIDSAILVAKIIFYARKGMTKEKIMAKLNLKIEKPEIVAFNFTCADTMAICLYALFNSTSFEESIKTAISFGGDTDTNACIVGSMAEAMYGMSTKLAKKAWEYLPEDFCLLLKNGYQNIYK